MARPETVRGASAPFTRYPRRCFPGAPLRRHEAASDRLLQHILGRRTPDAMTRPRRRPVPSRTRPGRRLSLRAAAHRWSALLALWRHCDDGGCRTGRVCRSDPLSCLPRYLPRLPPAARLWFACVGLAAERNVSFAEAAAMTEGDVEHVCARWQTAVGKALPPTLPKDASRA